MANSPLIFVVKSLVVKIAALAQLVEQLLRKEKVVSSTPTSGTTNLIKVVWEISNDLFLRLFVLQPATNCPGNRATLASHTLAIFSVAVQRCDVLFPLSKLVVQHCQIEFKTAKNPFVMRRSGVRFISPAPNETPLAVMVRGFFM